MLRSIWNLYQSIRNRIPHLSSAAEHFLSPSEPRDRKYSISCTNNYFLFFGPSFVPSCSKTFWKLKIEIFLSRSSDGLKKCSAILGRCGIRFLIDWWRFQIDLSTPTTLKAQKHYFLMKFTRQNFRKVMIFLLFQILDCDFEGFKIIFRTSSCHERFLRGSNKSNIGSKYFSHFFRDFF